MGDMHKHLVKIGPAVREICSQTDTQTDTHAHGQTHRQTDRNTQGQSNNTDLDDDCYVVCIYLYSAVRLLSTWIEQG